VDYIVDTDHLTILQLQSGREFIHIRAHLQAQSGAVLRTTVIRFQEHVQGWLAYIHKARTDERIWRGYARLSTLLRDYCRAIVLPFDEAAQARFDQLRSQRLRVGTLDLRIASIALSTGATLLPRNLRDFRKVPGLAVDDWTRAL
jgi:tRNA(fMet)-specific endonuclease VapC